MAATTARVLALLEIMQSGGVHTVAELGRRLEVDERTVRRSVALLLDVGVPVVSLRGRYGGYRLAPGYRMPPLMLTDDEAVAVVLGLLTIRNSKRFRLNAAASESASLKIRRVLPDRLKHRVGALVDIARFDAPAPVVDAAEAGTLLDLAEAAHACLTVTMTYRNRTGETRERSLDPYGIVAHASRWYVIGAESSGGEERTFRVDRVLDVRRTSRNFTPPANFDAGAAVLSALEATPWTHEVSVIVHAGVDRVRTSFPAGIASLVEMSDGTLRMTLRAERLDWVARGLAALDRPFLVERPTELAEHVRALADRLRESADRER